MEHCWNVFEAPEQNLSQGHSHHHKTRMELPGGETGLLDLMPGAIHVGFNHRC